MAWKLAGGSRGDSCAFFAYDQWAVRKVYNCGHEKHGREARAGPGRGPRLDWAGGVPAAAAGPPADENWRSKVVLPLKRFAISRLSISKTEPLPPRGADLGQGAFPGTRSRFSVGAFLGPHSCRAASREPPWSDGVRDQSQPPRHGIPREAARQECGPKSAPTLKRERVLGNAPSPKPAPRAGEGSILEMLLLEIAKRFNGSTTFERHFLSAAWPAAAAGAPPALSGGGRRPGPPRVSRPCFSW